jgi:hypothetical protein
MEALTAGNLSLIHFRLGNYELARDWAMTATLNDATPENDWAKTYSSLRLARAQAMLGEASRAIQTAEACMCSYSAARPWASQSLGLLVADIYELCGEHRLALLTANNALSESGWEPKTRAFAGTYARWIAKIGLVGGDWNQIHIAFQPLLNTLASNDLVDQAEILGAWGWFARNSANGENDSRGRLDLTLGKLPDATIHQLRRLGFLPS